MDVVRGAVVFVTTSIVAVGGSSASVWAAGPAVIEEPSAGASAEVIAQAVVAFDDGEYHWTLASLAINQTVTPLESTSPTFLLAGGPVAVLVTSPDGQAWRLGAGEAVFRSEGSASDVAAVADGAAGLTTITVDPGPGSGAFTPGVGARDLDLVRGQLPPGGSLTVNAEVSALVYVTAGQVETTDTTILAGSTTIRPGAVTMTNNATEPATVVVAAIGPAVEVSAAVSEGTEPPAADPQPAPAPSPTAQPAPAPAPTTTIDPATADVDGDGLSGADESLRGTDPDDDDSDDDGLTDGFEVFETGTSPTVADGDGDGLNDGDEINAGTNPNADGDSDGDGVPDADEVLSGGNPFDPTDQP